MPLGELKPLNARYHYQWMLSRATLTSAVLDVGGAVAIYTDDDLSPAKVAFGVMVIGIVAMLPWIILLWVIPKLRMFCPQCDSHVAINVGWRCSHCTGENRTIFNNFVHKCKSC